MSPHASSEGATAKSGDLVLLDFALWSESGGRTELIDTTRSDVAETEKFAPPESRTFEPQAHLIGGDFFPPGIENSLAGLKFDEEVTREFAPAEAFGERDPKLIELFTMHEIERLPEMRRRDAHLDLGTVLTINGRRGRVVTLTAARVRVDFNPPFAGRKIRGSFRVVRKIVDPVEEARAVVDLTYGRGKEFHVEHREGTFTLKVPDRAKFDLNWLAAKPRVIDRLRTQLKPESIRLVEEYVTPAPSKEKETSPAGPTGDSEKGEATAKHDKPAKRAKAKADESAADAGT